MDELSYEGASRVPVSGQRRHRETGNLSQPQYQSPDFVVLSGPDDFFNLTWQSSFFIFNYSFGGGRGGGRVLLFLSFKIQIFTAFKMHFLPSHFNIYKVKMYLTGGMYFNLVGFISSSEKLLSNKW